MASRVDSSVASAKSNISPSLLPTFAGTAALAIDGVLITTAGLFSRQGYYAATGILVDRGVFFGTSLMLAFLFAILMRSNGLYEIRNLLTFERQLRSAVLTWFTAFGLILGFGFLLKASSDLSRGAALVLAGTGLVLLVAHRLAWAYGLRHALSNGMLRSRNAIVLSSAPWASITPQLASLDSGGIKIAQRLFLPADAAGRDEIVGRAVAYGRENAVDEIVLLVTPEDLPGVNDLVKALGSLPVPVRLMPDAAMSRLVLQPVRRVGNFALVDISREPLSASELGMKRALDLVVAGLALVATAPLILLAMVAIRLDSPGPVLFRQSRRGFNGRSFKILKLRTMSVLEDGAGVRQAQRHDPRVTRVGGWLRRTSIDELPQLWNVLRGEMSIVGPRPHAIAHDNYYDTLIENYAFRHHVKPGLTGWAQVNGHRGETPEVSMMAARVDHDVWYINNWSLWTDVKILCLTVFRLTSRTAY